MKIDLAMEGERLRACNDIDELLDESAQVWLMGAGISKKAGLPLMGTLTDLVEQGLKSDEKYSGCYRAVRQELRGSANVEDVLSHFGDLIAIAERSKAQKAKVGGTDRSIDELRATHSEVRKGIQSIIRWGCKEEGNLMVACDEGSKEVDLDPHRCFVEALYKRRRGPREVRPVTFFTTNYDTLLEDALSHSQLSAYDGFTGGSVGYWDPGDASSYSGHSNSESEPYKGFDARLYKLHGSIDWVERAGTVMRCRDAAAYEVEGDELLIYPQATKYKLTQRDPFASLFSILRSELSAPSTRLLATCGYSFSDEHINEEIFRVLRGNDHLTLLAFLFEKKISDDSGEAEYELPEALRTEMEGSESSREQIIVATNRGIYDKSTKRKHESDDEYNWCTFEGLTDFLNHGVNSLEQ